MTAPRVRLCEGAAERVRELAAAAYPHEGCGVLIGRLEDGAVTVSLATSAANIIRDRQRDRYEIDPADFVRADGEARARGLDVVGFWHSHPDHPARPSRLDSERAWPDYVYVICGTTAAGTEEVAAFALPHDGDLLEPVSLDGAAP